MTPIAARERTLVYTAPDGLTYEHARMRTSESGAAADGAIVGLHEGQPIRLRYEITCDSRWHVRSASVEAMELGRTLLAKNIKPIAGLRSATLLVTGLINNCCNSSFLPNCWIAQLIQQLSHPTIILAIVNRHIGYIMQTCIYLCRTEKTIIRKLFFPMR